MRTFFEDLRYAARMAGRNPGFTAVAVAVLALGIGANTGIFSLVNALVLKPVMIRDARQVVGCYSRDTRNPDSYRAFSYPNYTDLRAGNPVFSELAAHNPMMVGLREGETTRRVFGDTVSSNFFAALGVLPALGRTFNAGEERAGSAIPVTILSHAFWKRLGSDPAILGKPVRVNERVLTVVGVMPEGFTGTTALASPSLYLPLGMFEAMANDFDGKPRPLAARDNYSLTVFGRLRDGQTIKSAGSQLAVVASRMEKAYPAENKNQTLIVQPLSRLSISTSPQTDGGVTGLGAMLVSIAGVVLLIASLNVASMMLARATARRKEIAIRLSLGSGRARILRQLLTEGLLLSLAGASAGLLVSEWGTAALVRSLSRLAPMDLAYTGGADPRVLCATLAFSIVSTLLFAFGPGWNLTKANVQASLKQGEAQDPARGRLFSGRNLLVMGQIALSLPLLTAAGLFLRGSFEAVHADPGFDTSNGVVAEVDAGLAGFDEPHGRQAYAALLERLGAMAGVRSASIAATIPFGMVSLGKTIKKPGSTATQTAPGGSSVGISGGRSSAVRADGTLSCSYNLVGARYFETLGIPLLRGREFSGADTRAAKLSVAIVDSAAAARMWPGGDALGKHVRVIADESKGSGPEVEIVGVVGNVKDHIIGGGEQAHLYAPFGPEFQTNAHFHVKLASTAPGLIDSVRREIRAVDDRLPVLALKTLRDHLESSMDIWITRTAANLFGVMGGVALALATIGLYGVRAYTVVRRSREIGIRMALGASTRQMLWGVLREGLTLTAVGAATGFALSLAIGKLLASYLYRVGSADPVVLTMAPLTLAAVSLLACYLPARRAAKVDPMVALRYE